MRLPSTGDARADLDAMARSVATNLEDPMSRAVAAAALSGTGDGRLKELSDRFWDDRIGKAAEIVKAGQKESQIDAKLDPSVVVVEIIGPIWFRVMVLQSPVDRPFIEALVDGAIR